MSHAAPLLGISEIASAQEHLLPGFEGWHPEVGAAGTAESIAQVALLREETIMPEAECQPTPEGRARRTGSLISQYGHSGLKELTGCVYRSIWGSNTKSF